MFIQTEATPNPATVKFLPGQEIYANGPLDFQSEKAAEASPLAKRLFGLAGVCGIMLGTDFVSVSKKNDTDWNVLKPMVLGVLMEHLATGQVIVNEAALEDKASAEDDDELVIQIKQLLEERVRPAVAKDGGDIIFDSFTDGIVYLKLRGACSGCPSSTMTLKAGIENMLRHYVPEVEEVRAVPD